MTVTMEFTPRQIEVINHALIMLGGRMNDKAKKAQDNGEKFISFLHKMEADEAFDLACDLPEVRESDEDHRVRTNKINEDFLKFGQFYVIN